MSWVGFFDFKLEHKIIKMSYKGIFAYWNMITEDIPISAIVEISYQFQGIYNKCFLSSFYIFLDFKSILSPMFCSSFSVLVLVSSIVVVNYAH